MKAVLYARVSSKEQEDGFSIPAQLKLIKEYAVKNKLKIIKEFIDVETAKQAGRSNFNSMIDFLKSNLEVKNILCEKTDRLYRNFKDYITIEDLELKMHLVKENEVLSKESKSHLKFIHGIKILMAKNYIDNLSEETKKGMLQKANEGYYPSFAPLGYLNIEK
ncbi:MAG: recombinase family protein [Proteobacteria bacterium]|nr:recombinase family protein [Pseudomonadota bacterium]